MFKRSVFYLVHRGDTLISHSIGRRSRKPACFYESPLLPYVETYQGMRRLETLGTKNTQLLCSVTFLLCCRDTDLIPPFLHQERHFQSSWTMEHQKNEYERYGRTKHPPPTPTLDNKRTVVHVSKYQLNPAEISILAKWGNRFAGKNLEYYSVPSHQKVTLGEKNE